VLTRDWQEVGPVLALTDPTPRHNLSQAGVARNTRLGDAPYSVKEFILSFERAQATISAPNVVSLRDPDPFSLDDTAFLVDSAVDLALFAVSITPPPLRARRKRGQYRRTLTIPGAQLRHLAELGYLERVDDPVAQVRALEAFLFDSLQ
jgi:hypothetical protein